MGRVWVAAVLAIVLVLTGPCFCDTGTSAANNNNNSSNGTANANETLNEATTEFEEYEFLPEAAPLTGDQEWVDTLDDGDGAEDDGTDDDSDDIETAGSEVVSTVIKQDEAGPGGEEEPGMRRRRKKGRKRRRRMRKRPRTTTPTAVEGEAYPTPPPASSTSEEIPPPPERSPALEEQPEEAYPRRRPGKRRRRPWSRQSTPATPESAPSDEQQSPQVPEEASEEPPVPRRRRKRPKNRNRIPIEIVDSSQNPEDAPKSELPENHKQNNVPELGTDKPLRNEVVSFRPPLPTKDTHYVEQDTREGSRFNVEESAKGEKVQKVVTYKQQSTERPIEQRPRDYAEQKPKEYVVEHDAKGPPTEKPRDYSEQKLKHYPAVTKNSKDYPVEQKPNPIAQPKPKEYQSFGPTNRPNFNKQFQPQSPKYSESSSLNDQKQPSAGPILQNIPFRANGYDGFQQFQKIYGPDSIANVTQPNLLKHQEQVRTSTDKGLKPTAPSFSRNPEGVDDKYQNIPPKFGNQNVNSFENQPTPSRPEIKTSSYGQGYGPPKPTHGSFSHAPKENKPESERSTGFPPYEKPVINVQQGPVQYSKPKPIGTKDTEPQSTTYKPSNKPQNENLLIIQNRPENNNQYAKHHTTNYQNSSPHESGHRNKGNPPGISNDGFHKSAKPENPFNNAPLLVNSRVPSIPQQNIFKQIASQNQFPAHASVIVSDIETNSAKPQFVDVNDLTSKLKPPQSIEQFNHQLIDPTLLTSPVLFEPPVPPVFEEEVPATKSSVSKVQLPPIQYPKAKFPPAPFLPSSQKQLPNTQFQRQAEPAPFRLPQKPELSQTPVTPPTQGTFQQPSSNQKKTSPQPSSVENQEKGKQSIHVPAIEQYQEVKPFVPTNIAQQTTTAESETLSYVESESTKAPSVATPSRKSPFSHAKRLPPTSAVIRRKVRPRPQKNTTENTQTTDNKENLNEKYRGTGNRNKNVYRQHLTEVEPTQKSPELEVEPNENDELHSDYKPLSAYGTNDKPIHFEEEETTKSRVPQDKVRYTTLYPEISITEDTTPKQGRFGLHHVSAQQEILRQTLQKQGKDSVRTNHQEESTNPPFVPYKSTTDEIETDIIHETNPPPVISSSKKTHSFTSRKQGHRQRTKGHEILVTTPTTPKYTSLEIITDRPKYSDEYEFMVSDDELLKMMKPMMGDDLTDQRDTEELRFKAANIHGVKDEILDLIKTNTGSARLSRILKLRNMSLDDLIKHRERGSSQLHLSEIFTKNKHAEATVLPELPEIVSIPNYAENLDDDIAAQITPIFQSNYIKNKEQDRTRGTASVTEIKTYNGDQYDRDNNREPKVFESMPSFTLRTDILEKINEKKENPSQKTDWRFFGQVGKPQRPYDDVVISYTSTNRYPYRKPSVEEIDDIILLSDADQYDAPRSNVIHAKVLADSGEKRDQEFFNETKKLSTGVKSAILVSGAIIGIAVLGFFALMISCRIKQKKARLRAQRDILCDHFHEELRSSARSTSPVMPQGMEENTCEHGVRSTAIPTRHYNNRHYYLWRTLRKTFQYE